MAMTGAVLGNTCYPSNADAVDAYYSAAAPVMQAASQPFITLFEKVGGVWKMKVYQADSGGIWTIKSTGNAAVITFPACDPAAPFIDGVTIGWGIAAAMVMVSALMIMKRGARGG